MIEVELRILCSNKIGHCLKRFIRLNNNLTDYEKEEEIRVELGKYDAVYEYLDIKHFDNKIIATAYNS